MSGNQTNAVNPMRQPNYQAMDLYGKPKMSQLNRFIPNRMTNEGLSFLKASFASVDQADFGAFTGIPDGSPRKTVGYRHLLIDSAQVALSKWDKVNTKFCFLVLPTPGVAYWYAENIDLISGITGTTIFHPVYYDDFDQLFKDPSLATEQVSEFRYGANWFELVPTMNPLSWSGGINVKKFNVTLGDCPGYTIASKTYTKALYGLESCNSTSMPAYSAPMNLGAYVCTVNKSREFEWSTIMEDYDRINDGNNSAFGVLDEGFRGLGNLEGALITLSTNAVSTPGSTSPIPSDAFQVRCGCSIEYIPQGKSIIAKMSTPSPQLDVDCLNAYYAVAQNMPIAVSYYDNAGFWSKVWDFIKTGAKALSNIPGPLGLVATGVSTALQGGEAIYNAFRK